MQSIEKDKATSALRDYNEVKRDYCQTIKENEMIKAVWKQHTKVFFRLPQASSLIIFFQWSTSRSLALLKLMKL